MSNKAKESRSPDLKIGLKQHTLTQYMPTVDFIQISLWFKDASAELQAEIAEHVAEGTITITPQINPTVKLVEDVQMFDNCFNGKTQKNDAQRRCIAYNPLQGRAIPPKEETATTKKNSVKPDLLGDREAM